MNKEIIMSRETRQWHPDFITYMDEIISHPNYKGLPIDKKSDGTYKWIAPAQSEIGKARIKWCENKAKELGLKIQPGVYADVMLAIHPTKYKVCQTCGRKMSLYYHYPNTNFLKKLNSKFSGNYTECDHISNIWDDIIARGYNSEEIAQFLILSGKLTLDSKTSTKEEIISALEFACRKGNLKCLGPGAMSNFPDRFDGFHTYNRCCRSNQDKGRSKENLKSYTKDRRAYEYWSDGNIHAANLFMGSSFFNGTSADHIGPISLGFVHDPRYIQPMSGSENSTKRDRLQLVDIRKILDTENRTSIYPMSWYSILIWEHIKTQYGSNTDKISTVYRDALKQNMANFMYVLWYILENTDNKGKAVLISAFLEPKYQYFQYHYEFNSLGEIIKTYPRHITERSSNEFERYKRIAIEAVYDFNDKTNRHVSPNLSADEKRLLEDICITIKCETDTSPIEHKIRELMNFIQHRSIASL